MVVEREPDSLSAAAPFPMRLRDWFLVQIRQSGSGFVAALEAIATTGYRSRLRDCIERATAYHSVLRALPCDVKCRSPAFIVAVGHGRAVSAGKLNRNGWTKAWATSLARQSAQPTAP